jgi:hypothetical protein
MSSPHSNDDRFDRLVDGELSEPERQRLLTALDQEPEGWRRCALAFLEAQCWREGFGNLFRPTRTAAAVPRSPAGRSWSYRGVAGTVLAMAASFLLAFGLAAHWYGDGQAVQPLGNGPEFAANRPETSILDVHPAPLGRDSSSWQLVGLPAGGAGNGQIVIPAVQRDRWDDRLMNTMPSAVPKDVLQAFERSGHRVQQQRELVPVQMDDGRVLIVPVEQMEIQPARGPVY